MQELIDLFLHLDVHLAEFVAEYGAWVYGLLFAIVFAETGLVVTPFLPGDSLLFAAGALSATGALDIRLVVLLLVGRRDCSATPSTTASAATSGRASSAPRTTRAAAPAAEPRTISIARTRSSSATAAWRSCSTRFVPIVRTFVPFVAGAGAMRYSAFAFYNVAGACCGWGLRRGRATRSGTCRS